MTENETFQDPHWEVLVPAEVIQHTVGLIAKKVSAIIEASTVPVVLAFVANGGLWLGFELVRRLPPRGYRWAVITAQSYGVHEDSQSVVLTYDGLGDISGCRVIVVDDIFDSGSTCQFLHGHLLKHGATEVRFVVLLEKPDRKSSVVKISPDVVGLIIPNVFVCGCGLDGGEKSGYTRNFPDVRCRVEAELPNWRFRTPE